MRPCRPRLGPLVGSAASACTTIASQRLSAKRVRYPRAASVCVRPGAPGLTPGYVAGDQQSRSSQECARRGGAEQQTGEPSPPKTIRRDAAFRTARKKTAPKRRFADTCERQWTATVLNGATEHILPSGSTYGRRTDRTSSSTSPESRTI